MDKYTPTTHPHTKEAQRDNGDTCDLGWADIAEITQGEVDGGDEDSQKDSRGVCVQSDAFMGLKFRE